MRIFVVTSLVIAAVGTACTDRSRRGAEPTSSETPVEPSAVEATAAQDAVVDGGGRPDVGADAFVWTGPQVETMPWQEVMALDGSASTSIGSPNDGRVEGAVPFPLVAPGIRLNPRRFNEDSHFGTVETIQSLIKAAAVVARELPGGPPIIINDLGLKQGGPIPHHGSHQAGRDVDVLFSMLDRDGAPQPARCVSLNLAGEGWDFMDLSDPSDDEFFRLDVQRSWRFLQALAEEEGTTLQRVFVAEHIRNMLLEEAERVGAPRAAREIVEAVTCQPGSPHDDHFHIRFFCTAQDIAAGCQDSSPMFPWRIQQLRAVGVRPVMERRRPRRRRSGGDLVERAIADAGPPHEKVKAFLREREAWRRPPITGRPYCR